MKRDLLVAALVPLLVTSCGGLAQDGVSVTTSELSSVDSAPRGFTRADNAHQVVYRLPSGSIGRLKGPPNNRTFRDLGGQSASAPWGYLRKHTDFIGNVIGLLNATVYISSDGHVHELGETAPVNTDFMADVPGLNAPLAKPSGEIQGYIRTDKRSAMIYVSSTNEIIELATNFINPVPTPWLVGNLTAVAAADPISGRPSVVNSPNRIQDAIVYRTATNHIGMILRSSSGPWSYKNLTMASGDAILAKSEPSAYFRTFATLAVIFIGTDNKLHELSSLDFGTTWTSGIITAAVDPLSFRPSGYVRSDGVVAVTYISGNSTVHEVSLNPAPGSTWVDGVLPFPVSAAANSEPYAFSSASINAVLVKGNEATGTRGFEFYLPNGGVWNASSF